jgi:hypothetical protein
VTDTRAILADLVAARSAGSRARVSALLADDVRYWDCERGNLAGREAVGEALMGHVAVETIAAAGDDAVLELQGESPSCSRSTEVYRLAGGAIASIKAYFDPDVVAC